MNMCRPPLVLIAFASLAACAAPPARNSDSFYYASTPRTPAPQEVGGLKARATAARNSQPQGASATAAPTARYMEQYRESGPFGSYTGSTVIQSTGAVESYQTIGNTPVYPGMAVPGYMPGQPYQGPRNTSQPPVFVPGTGANPGYYINPATGARVGP